MTEKVDGTPPIYSHATSTHFTEQYERSSQEARRTLHPWLRLRSRLFLSIFTPALASLAFVFVALLTAMSSVDRQADDVKLALMSACKTMEASATTLLNSPHIMSAKTNEAIAATIEQTVHGVAQLLVISLTAVQAILEFLVDSYRGLFLCFIQLLVSASLSLLSSAVDALSGVVRDLAQAARTSIQASVTAINATLKAALGGLDDVLKIIGKSITVPQISMPSLTALENVTLPNDLTNGLIEINSSMPTLDSIRTAVNSFISQPFESMQREINSTIAQYSFNRTVLPEPALETLSICDQSYADHANIDQLVDALRKGAKIGILLLLIIAVLLIAFTVLSEWWSWNSLQRHVRNLHLAAEQSQDYREGWLKSCASTDAQRHNTITTYGLMSLLQLSTHPKIAELALRCGQRYGIRSWIAINRFRWWLAWATHPAPLATLSMGLVGLIATTVQIIVIEATSYRARQETTSSMDDLVNTMRNAVNARLSNASVSFADTSNAAILKVQNDLNSGIFTWLNTTTSTVESALNELMGGLATAVNSTFASTPLFTPVQSFVGCIVGDKVMDVERALNWIQSNAQVNFTLVSNDVFVLDPTVVQQALVKPANSAIGGDDGNSGLLGSLSDTYLNSLRHHRLLFVGLIVLYAILLIIGLVVVLIDSTPSRRRPGFWSRSKSSSEPGQAEGSTPLAAPSLFQDPPPRSESPAVRTGHRSISQPLLPDVLSIHQQLRQGFHKQTTSLPPYSPDGRAEQVPLLAHYSQTYAAPPQTQFDLPSEANEIALQRRSRIL